MTKLLFSLKKLMPDQIEILARRYYILRAVKMLQPVGRRGVAQYLDLSERTVRGEVDKLGEEGLILILKLGMSVTNEGEEVLDSLESMIHEILGLSLLEIEIKKLLGISKVTIVQGDCDENKNVKKDIGIAAAHLLIQNTNVESTIALTGGSTMTCLVESILSSTARRAKLVVPARGSVGHRVEQQSDTLVSKLAEKLKAEYRLLNIPDNMGIKAMNEIKNEPNVQDALSEMQNASILAFGIGDALKMAEKRRVSEPIFDFLVRKEATAEAFGYYFNKDGEIVYSSRSISINLENIKKIPTIIAVAGGHKKAASIIAVSKNLKNAIMVMDEGAAREIIRIFDEKTILLQ